MLVSTLPILAVAFNLSSFLMPVQAKFQPRSWVSALAAPRETVVEQLWRQDENGVYLVMIHSMDHPAVPVNDLPWYHWFSPVRAQVHASLPVHCPHHCSVGSLCIYLSHGRCFMVMQFDHH